MSLTQAWPAVFEVYMACRLETAATPIDRGGMSSLRLVVLFEVADHRACSKDTECADSVRGML